jgi:uncharacterized membrane protein
MISNGAGSGRLPIHMQINLFHILLGLIFFEFSRTVASTYVAGVVLFVIGILTARNDLAQTRGLDKVVALGNLFFALPLAVFGAEHFSAAQGISQMVPKFVPWHLFWTYFVGTAWFAAALSIATKAQVRWSGLLLGVAMFSFVAMIDLPGAIAEPHVRFNWILVLRELSFGAGGWVLAGAAIGGRGGNGLITVGRVIIGAGAIVYGVQHFLHPANVPGVPLAKVMPGWIPAPALIGYVTGAILLVAGVCILIGMKTRMAATYLGAWIALLVFTLYLAILIASFSDPSTDVKVEAVNYFTDTMLYAGTILALARAAASIEQAAFSGQHSAVGRRDR